MDQVIHKLQELLSESSSEPFYLLVKFTNKYANAENIKALLEDYFFNEDVESSTLEKTICDKLNNL